MDMNMDMYKLICELEYLIGKECYNPRSYDGWNDVEGCSFRYPVRIKIKYGDKMVEPSLRCNLNNSYGIVNPEQDFNQKVIDNLKYKFGANEMYIGLGIQNVLKFLEQRYNLNFTQLEEEYQKNLNCTK